VASRAAHPGLVSGDLARFLPSFLLPRDSVMAMNSFVLVGMASALADPLHWFLRTRLRSMTLFREAFFWRLRRDLRKQRTIQ
jgi:hypothetical protein